MQRENKKHINNIIVTIQYSLSKLIYKNDLDKLIDTISHAIEKNSIIDNNIIEIMIAAEDKRFYRHFGFDILAIFRALFKFIFYYRKSGASTIDQQLVRTITQNKNFTINRKIKEIILASSINNIYTKYEIAYSYICLAYYGWRMHGYNSAYIRIKNENIVTENDILYAIISLLKYPLPRYPSDKSLNKIYNRISYIKFRLSKLNYKY
ncbi:MAG: transglycosylase domain-containing protein [Desulfobulbus sp.]|nr:transglycosylase domain-containing protein [Desulfobulbus sp.]